MQVAVVGASGYTGAELVRLLLGHPRAELAVLCGSERSAGVRIDRLFPQLAGVLDCEVEPFDPARVADRAEVVFLALPHGASAAAAAALVGQGGGGPVVIDLSADLRLRDAAIYREYYGPHPHPELLERAVYGLPELHRDELGGARLIAGPGCYPTATILAAAPLLARGLIAPRGLVVDAKSGVSGAGRSAAQPYHFPEVGEGIRAYKPAGGHRHTPEMVQELSRVAAGGGAGRAQGGVTLTFTPHLVPMSRGILSCVYGQPTDPARPEADYQAAVAEAWASEPFVTALDGGRLPDTSHVRGSNRAQVAVRLDARAGVVVAMAAIDNLVKGAAGQAVQCMNLACGFAETEGLTAVAPFP